MRGRLRTLGFFAIILAMTSGCLTGGEVTGPLSADLGKENEPPIVIALLDSGTNPYLEVFRAPSSPVVVAGATELQLAFDGQFFLDDQAAWEDVEANRLYHFSGTRLYAIGMDETPTALYPIITQRHGQQTSYLAARDAPNAVIVMVQVDISVCDDPSACIVDPSIAEGMEWIAEQDWIDVVSVSLGFPGNPPGLPPEAARFIAASERAAASGKIVVNAGGNEIVPPVTGFTNGLPWVICVGGFETSTNGESLYASKTSDVVANYSEMVPTDWNGTLGPSHGTSFGAPVVAATLAIVLDELRRVDASLTDRAALREALNASAVVVGPTAWRPDPADPLDMGIPVVAPGQIGWGYVDASLAPEIARRILEGDLSPPAEKAEIALWQAQWQGAREAYWDAARR